MHGRLLAMLLIGLLLPTVAMAFKPGEGEEELIGGLHPDREFEAGYYRVKILGRVWVRYRFSTLLGDHVEKFEPRYEISSVTVTEPSGKLVFSASVDAFTESVRQSSDTDLPYFSVSKSVMNRIRMIQLQFRLEPCVTGERSRYHMDRWFQGLLRPPGQWGWDFPASAQWNKVLLDSNNSPVNAAEAKRYWTKMALSDSPTCGGRLLNATFDTFGLMGAITREIPDAFRKSEGVSPAFAQMSSLYGQLEAARERGDADLKRREQLTERAWQMLRSEMNEEERRILSADRATSNPEPDITQLDALLKKAEQQLSVENGQLTKSTEAELNKALRRYTPARLTQLKLPTGIHTMLQKLASGGDKSSEWVRAEGSYREEGQYGRWGFKDKNGNWTIRPQYRHVRDFDDGIAVVGLSFAEVRMIDHQNNIVGPDSFRNSQSWDWQDSTMCLEGVVIDKKSVGGQVFDKNTRTWLTDLNVDWSCDKSYNLITADPNRLSGVQPVYVFSTEGERLVSTRGTSVFIEKDYIYVRKRQDAYSSRCVGNDRADKYFRVEKYDHKGKLINDNDTYIGRRYYDKSC